MLRAIACALAAAALCSAPAHGTEVRAVYSGVPIIIDGDTFDLGGDRIRLADVDAPELWQQSCVDKHEVPDSCGRKVRDWLRAAIGGQAVQCSFVGWLPARLAREKDGAYARCFLGGQDLGELLVREGMAVPSQGRPTYRSAGLQACARGKGLWAGRFENPQTVRGRHFGQLRNPQWLGALSGRACLFQMNWS